MNQVHLCPHSTLDWLDIGSQALLQSTWLGTASMEKMEKLPCTCTTPALDLYSPASTVSPSKILVPVLHTVRPMSFLIRKVRWLPQCELSWRDCCLFQTHRLPQLAIAHTIRWYFWQHSQHHFCPASPDCWIPYRVQSTHFNRHIAGDDRCRPTVDCLGRDFLLDGTGLFLQEQSRIVTSFQFISEAIICKKTLPLPDLTEGGTPSIEMVPVFGRLPQVQVAKRDSQ